MYILQAYLVRFVIELPTKKVIPVTWDCIGPFRHHVVSAPVFNSGVSRNQITVSERLPHFMSHQPTVCERKCLL